ncbi:MAG: DMT family transporter [Archaeoglobaceae archaeon]|nr:DMT family transporter [Archaeoglobaceae archaeon]MCX8152072.1 DMT family transporter [Archaeoglobaceae archaeon]MDW8013837.1 DMT family transporter [Archaeoglobaceae archaeon]
MHGELLALIAAILWGLAPIFDKLALQTGVSIYVANFVRLLSAVLITFVFAAKYNFNISLNATFYLIIAGTIGGVVAMLLYYSALSTSETAKVVAITASYPLFTALFAYILLGEEISFKTLLGILLVFLGILLLSK